jgi:hypothetical protein
MCIKTWFSVALLSLLSGCGVEVASTAVTAAQLQATQAKQATAQAEQLKGRLNAAMQPAESAASAAGQP